MNENEKIEFSFKLINAGQPGNFYWRWVGNGQLFNFVVVVMSVKTKQNNAYCYEKSCTSRLINKKRQKSVIVGFALINNVLCFYKKR